MNIRLNQQSSVFTKNLTEYTPAQIKLIFEKSGYLHNRSKHIAKLTIPEPLSCSYNSIVFKRIPITRTWVNDLKMGFSWDPYIFHSAGSMLGKLHSKISDLGSPILCLSDFVPANICIRDSHFTLFDFEPPPGMENFFDFYYRNLNYLDIAAFIFATWTPHPLERFYRFFSDHSIYCNAFLNGYISETGFCINFQILRNYIQFIYSGYRYRMLSPKNRSIKRIIKLSIIGSFLDLHIERLRT